MPHVEPVGIDTSVVASGGVYDYWLASDQQLSPPDREAAEARARRDNRGSAGAGPGRAADFRAPGRPVPAGPAGISQFLDLGTGIPSANNTHEVAQSVNPSARVVYWTTIPIVAMHGERAAELHRRGLDPLHRGGPARSAAHPGRGAAGSSPSTAHRPSCCWGCCTSVPDDQDPWGIVERIVAAVPVGSYPS
jgi:hypothetical protein